MMPGWIAVKLVVCWYLGMIVLPSGGCEESKAPLSQPYSSDARDMKRIREENLKIYNFSYNTQGIDRRSNLSLQEYRDVYDGKWPVIVTDVVPKWPAFKWTGESLAMNYGKERVTMKAVKGKLRDAAGFALPLAVFYSHVAEAYPNQWTYLNDELFIPTRPELKSDIGYCEYLEEDFFKLFPTEVRPWDAMLLWGTKFSRSALHVDPYNWTGTNAVITGIKRWKLYPPVQDEKLYVFTGRSSGFPLDCQKYNSPIDAFDPDFTAYPLFSSAEAIEFDQYPGELLIIPSGWFHQAYNVEETLAVSGQVMNRNNYRVILEEILNGRNLPRSQLPSNIDKLPPAEQVKTVMSLLPEEILKQGRKVTDDILKQIKDGGKNTDPHIEL